MNVSIILAHPAAGSFYHAIASRADRVLTHRILSILILCAFVPAWTTPGWCRADRVFFGMPGALSEEERSTLGSVIVEARGMFRLAY